MHRSAFANAEKFVAKYLDPGRSLKVLDVGSFNINGTLKPLFVARGAMCTTCGNVRRHPQGLNSICCKGPMKQGYCCDGIDFRPIDSSVKIGEQWEYYGMDVAESCNPYGDMKEPRNESRGVNIVAKDPYVFPLPDGFADVIVSTSCLEHDELFWVTFNEMVRVSNNNALIYLNVPSNGPYHGYPLDCWRFQKDSYRALSRWNSKATLLDSYIDQDVQMHGGWSDNIGIFRVSK